MEYPDVVAVVVVLLAGVYLLGLGATALTRPHLAATFLSRFGGSPRAHFAELAARLCAGAALLVLAPRMPAGAVFATAGWVLVVTTMVLLVMPWQWHQRFAGRTVPTALRFLPWIGAVSLAIGACVVAATVIATGR